MKRLIILGAGVLVSTMALAEWNYDYNTGNSYMTNRFSDGSSSTYGNNARTGSVWNSRTDSSGNSSGTDADGNYWRYNQGSGSYWNSNGTSCYGKGAFRHCD